MFGEVKKNKKNKNVCVNVRERVRERGWKCSAAWHMECEVGQ